VARERGGAFWRTGRRPGDCLRRRREATKAVVRNRPATPFRERDISDGTAKVTTLCVYSRFPVQEFMPALDANCLESRRGPS
jgi:hypothetical protein